VPADIADNRIPVMAGLVPAIHVLFCRAEDVDARDKPAHDDVR
jgi:hypothetical protein